ncbi:Beta-lactamase class C and other penicillin binding protein [Myroides sp. A21]|uniref:serine hydrolase domain-containing protein n=1 Tax=Myroides sp. A21 TaxID=1583100 RepID=UPI00057CE861|nr:serine hydrolase domain-containing protein [Myroides sp. A21]AJA67369.1 Beta-lactamase class C and other penicillin binding protein [Myroides sp. A21]
MKKIVVLVLLVVFSISCKKESSQRKAQDVSYTDSLTLAISKIYKQSDFNGFAVSIVNDKGTLYQKGFGYADIENEIPYTDKTIQNIASVSKVFVGVALLKAQELGKLKLDDPINNYLPFKVVNPSYPDKEITIRHLATHTSGIVDNEFYLSKNYILKEEMSTEKANLGFDDMQTFNPVDSIISIEEFLQNVLVQGGKWNTKDSYSKYKPGAMYEYSNIGTTLAAFVLEKATGERFDTFTEKYILEPLKMKDSGWSFQNVKFENYSKLYADKKTVLPFYHIITYPDGGFITSISDLSLFLTELIKGYNQKGTILNKESYKEFFRPHLKEANFLERDENNPYNESYNVGVFIGFGFSGYIGHTGGDPGVASVMFFDPKNNTGRILILNTSFSGQKGSQDFYGIWDVLEKYQDKLDN